MHNEIFAKFYFCLFCKIVFASFEVFENFFQTKIIHFRRTSIKCTLLSFRHKKEFFFSLSKQFDKGIESIQELMQSSPDFCGLSRKSHYTSPSRPSVLSFVPYSKCTDWFWPRFIILLQCYETYLNPKQISFYFQKLSPSRISRKVQVRSPALIPNLNLPLELTIAMVPEINRN